MTWKPAVWLRGYPDTHSLQPQLIKLDHPGLLLILVFQPISRQINTVFGIADPTFLYKCLSFGLNVLQIPNHTPLRMSI
ncbi:uncharacterized protein YALI1_B05954g [Yarrowia lipolytica]|uniref:Uncharacterized protein n=1 Tax=Yarrowia lipolytica TaxID=4952 RepID=A0A1D8N6F3_YARLL|nr:hypothetical protein YALI1_B05954g [Yarrowia lipolytica]